MRFFENYQQKNQKQENKLDLSDMGLGDNCMNIVAKMISKNRFTQLDISKNNFTDNGLKRIVFQLKAT